MWGGTPGDTYVNRPTATGRGSTHIDTAFMGLTSSGGVTSTASYKPEHHPVQSFPSHVIIAPNGPVRLQGESGEAARLVPVTVDGLILAAPEADRISVGAALMRFARGHYANWS